MQKLLTSLINSDPGDIRDHRHQHGSSGSPNNGHQHGLWWQHGSHTSTWPLTATETTDTNIDLMAGWAKDINTVPCVSPDHSCQDGLCQQHRSQMLTWPPVAALTVDIYMASTSNRVHRHQQPVTASQTTDTSLAPVHLHGL